MAFPLASPLGWSSLPQNISEPAPIATRPKESSQARQPDVIISHEPEPPPLRLGDTTTRTDLPVTAAEPVELAPVSNPQVAIAVAKATVLSELINLARSSDDFHALMTKAFGNDYDIQAAEGVRQRLLQGDFSWLPDIRTVGNETLRGACGAYSKDEHTVYLNEYVLSNPTLAAQAMAEEVGHHLDTLFN